MTILMEYNIDHLFFKICQEYLLNMDKSDSDKTIPSEETITKSAIVIICSLTGLEAVLNKILNHHKFITLTILDPTQMEDIKLKKLSIEDKINLIYSEFEKKADWGKKPLQDVKVLISWRNWLIHFKDESFLGILGSYGKDSCWVETVRISEYEEVKHKIPPFDPNKRFNYHQSKKFYDAVRSLVNEINDFLPYEELNLNEVVNENYRKTVSST
jgi:hypothetical protein